jgi:hypothetical protein
MTQEATEEQQLKPPVNKKKKKCHGNRKLQYFKRKCRARGLNEEQILARILNRTNDTIFEQLPMDQTIPERAHESHKRKRHDQSTQKSFNSSTKSMSQLSISQAAVSKKTKRSPIETTTMSSNNEISTETSSQSHVLDKPSKYLKMPRRLLLHSLHLQLNCSLKKKKEQRFILSRLRIIDQQFYLEQIRYLYKTYFDLGSKQQMWLVSFQTLACIFIPVFVSF